MRGKHQSGTVLRGSSRRNAPEIPHLFGKLMVLWCVLWGTAFCFYALRILSRTGHDPAALLGVILGFLGGELMLMCLRQIFGSKKKTPTDTGGV